MEIEASYKKELKSIIKLLVLNNNILQFQYIILQKINIGYIEYKLKILRIRKSIS